MSTSYGRPLSPGGRRIVNPGRASAGSSAPAPSHHDYSTTARASRDYVPVPRTSADRVDGPRVVALRQRSPPRKTRADDYQVRPRIRTNSLDPSDASKRRPLELPRSPGKISRPVITREVERPRSPISKAGGAQLEASYIMPASSSGRHHQRHASLNMGDRVSVRDRDRGRLYPSERTSKRDDRDYSYEYTNPKEQVLRDLAPPPQRRPRRESYTSARPTSMIDLDRYDKVYPRTEKDAPPPVAARGLETVNRHESLKHGNRPPADDLRKKESNSRHAREPRDDSRYHEVTKATESTRDEYVPYPEENSRHQRPRKPTLDSEGGPSKHRDHFDDRDDRHEDRHRRHAHHHDAESRKDLAERDPRHHRSRDVDETDDKERRRDYEGRSERDRRKDYSDGMERERRRHYDERDDRERHRDYEERDRKSRRDIRERYEDEEQASSHGGLLAAGGTAAATGLAAEAARQPRRKDEDVRDFNDSHGHYGGHDRSAEATGASSEPDETDREERRRRRRKEREREREYRETRDRLQQEGQLEPEPKRIEAAPPTEHALREQQSYERRPEDDQPRRRRHRRHRRHHPRTSDVESHSDSSESSNSDSATDRAARAARVVSPPMEGNELAIPKPAPKGILKPPRVRFPEEPQTVREGVAPLEAAKRGIPPEARWTKINRRLVNPEALEQEGVRFEEFPDHVIVLKVLSEEEISKYTKLTHEVRERRRLEQGSQASGSASGTGMTGPDHDAGGAPF